MANAIDMAFAGAQRSIDLMVMAARNPRDFFPLDEAVLNAMAAAPIDRCACPLPAHEGCHPFRCEDCHVSFKAVIAWILENGNGDHRRKYLQHALTLDRGYWNHIRRGLMAPLAPSPIVHVEGVVTCVICQEDVHGDVHFLPGAHGFHPACIRPWLHRQRTCPTCRAAA